MSMQSEQDLSAVVATYIAVIKLDSLEAAAAVQEILALCGSRAALRATLVITLLKMEYQENHVLQNVSSRSYLIREFPEARPLLEQALSCCLLAWETTRLALADPGNAGQTPIDGSTTPQASELPPV